MTNINGINYGQQVGNVVPQQIYTQQTAPQYVTAPYPNDAFVSSTAKKDNRAGKVIAGTLLTAAAVVGGSLIARKTVLKDYKKITENATVKQHLANIATTIADGTTKGIKTVAGKVKGLFSKSKSEQEIAQKVIDKYSVGENVTGKDVQKMVDKHIGIQKPTTKKAYDKKQKELEKAFANLVTPESSATAKPKKVATHKTPVKKISK